MSGALPITARGGVMTQTARSSTADRAIDGSDNLYEGISEDVQV